jgi:hypothetical protein
MLASLRQYYLRQVRGSGIFRHSQPPRRTAPLAIMEIKIKRIYINVKENHGVMHVKPQRKIIDSDYYFPDYSFACLQSGKSHLCSLKKENIFI